MAAPQQPQNSNRIGDLILSLVMLALLIILTSPAGNVHGRSRDIADVPVASAVVIPQGEQANQRAMSLNSICSGRSCWVSERN